MAFLHRLQLLHDVQTGPPRLDHPDDTAQLAVSTPQAVAGQDGAMTAPFAGNHGVFWRNRGDAPVTVILRDSGTFAEMVEVAQP